MLLEAKWCGLILWNFWWTFYPNASKGWVHAHSHQAVESASIIQPFLCDPLDTFWLAPSRRAPPFLPENTLWLCHDNTHFHPTMAMCAYTCIKNCYFCFQWAYNTLRTGNHLCSLAVVISGTTYLCQCLPDGIMSQIFSVFFRTDTVFLIAWALNSWALVNFSCSSWCQLLSILLS